MSAFGSGMEASSKMRGSRYGTTLPAVSRPQTASRPVTKSGTTKGVKREIDSLWQVIHEQKSIIAKQNEEIDRIRKVVEPMTDMLKRYTDQAERRITKKVDKQFSDQTKTNTRIDNSLAALRRANVGADERIEEETNKIHELKEEIEALKVEIFGDGEEGSTEVMLVHEDEKN